MRDRTRPLPLPLHTLSSHRPRPAQFVFALLFALLALTPALSAQPAPQNESLGPANLIISAFSLPAGVRYSVTYLKPSAITYDALLVEIRLPPQAEVRQVFATDQVAFIGTREDEDGGQTLIWSGQALDDTSLAPLAFTLDQAPEVAIEAQLQLQQGGADAGTFALVSKPAPILATADTAMIILGAEGTRGALLPVGETGVMVGAAPGILPENTEITVHELPAADNPSDTLDPSLDTLWWCSLVSIDGMPGSAAVSVVVSLRRPLAPFTPVALYAANGDGTWTPLAEQGIVSADGATVSYVHTGGTIATGVEGGLLPTLLEGDQIMPMPVTFTARITAPAVPDEAAGGTADFPSCSTVSNANTPPVVCLLFEGVYRQCLEGYINCTFSSRSFGTCFDAGVLGLEDGIGPLCAFTPATP